jgi:hypothetical protein
MRTSAHARFVVLSGYNRTAQMQSIDNREPRRNWLTSVLTDIHFWVPVVVLIGGLLLLELIH